MTQIIAIISLVIFTVVMLSIGIFSMSKTKTMDGFLLGGRKIGPWISAFAYGTTYFSAVIFVGYAGKFGWDIGVGSIWIGVGNAIIGCMIPWLLFGKRTRRMTQKLKVSTMPEFFAARYKSPKLKIYCAVIIFIFLVPYAASVYKGLGSLFSCIFPGVSVNICMLLVAVLTAVYLVLGGYIATALNDFIQGLIMIVGVIVMVILIANRPEVGGFVEGFHKLAEVGPQFVSAWGGQWWSFLVINIMLTSFGVWGLPQMIHKFYAIKDESDIKKATIISTVFATIIGCGAYFVGSLSRLFFAAAENGTPNIPGGYDSVIPNLLMNSLTSTVFSNILLSVILLLLLSASMSTLASVVLTSSSAISIDLIKEFYPKTKDKTQMLISRVLCILFIAFSYIVASMNITIIVNLMSFSWGVVAGSFIGPYIWGLFSKKTTKAGAISGAISGITVVFLCVIYFTITTGFASAIKYAPNFGVAAMAVSAVIVPFVSSFTKKFEAKHLDYAFSESKSEKVGIEG